MHILASTSVSHRSPTVQMPNVALIGTKWITVHSKSLSSMKETAVYALQPTIVHPLPEISKNAVSMVRTLASTRYIPRNRLSNRDLYQFRPYYFLDLRTIDDLRMIDK